MICSHCVDGWPHSQVADGKCQVIKDTFICDLVMDKQANDAYWPYLAGKSWARLGLGLGLLLMWGTTGKPERCRLRHRKSTSGVSITNHFASVAK